MAPKSKPKPKPKSESSSASAYFSPGTAVEVSSDDDGFRGSWFSGTVIRRLTSDRFLVEYDNLMADDESSKQLREVLNLRNLRPLPPSEPSREFKFGDEVDAFHNDGWWEGHITEELGDERFAVYFRVSREQLVFPKEQLRLHREWLHLNWVPPIQQPQKQANELKKVLLTPNVKSVETVKEDMFSVGKVVEVSSDEDGFQGAWFSATVVEVIGKEKFLVEYHSLLADDDSQLLREEVDVLHIRPHPPDTCVVDQFGLLEEVDALYNDGWWVGVISKVHDDSRYIVYFRSSNEELEFQHSQLRLHQDWIDGKWVMSSKCLIHKIACGDNRLLPCWNWLQSFCESLGEYWISSLLEGGAGEGFELILRNLWPLSESHKRQRHLVTINLETFFISCSELLLELMGSNLFFPGIPDNEPQTQSEDPLK
ncbi:hypothetical protein VNO77_13728 [Canavalia gladiata]|uniref:Agenet domain-containing protein n=1 Tax=Canavalia gladiata TaxID=3824 RepID=A0AAN9M2X5_CANGL